MTKRVARVAALACIFLLACGCERAPAPQAHSAAGTRIVTLAPHLSELVFDAGAGDRLVGVSAYSDYPPDVASIEIVSDAFTVDQERLRLLAPDLVLAWKSGTPAHVIEELQNAGYRVESIAAESLSDIASAIRRIGGLTGREVEAETVAATFERDMQALRQQFSKLPPITAFYQVSLKPLYTTNGGHYISEILGICGATNVFAELNELAPAVSVESVVARNPEAIFAGSADGNDAFVEWRRWPHLSANRFENYFLVNSDHIGRPTTRLVAATASMCESLQTARKNRAAYRQAQGS